MHEVLGKGANKASVRFGLEGLQVDLRALASESYGAAMQYFTGSKEHNVLLRSRALKSGLTLNEYGLFRLDDNTRVAGETEQGVYEALGLPWISPELRENCGEIEAALEGRLPKLLEMSDIRGDLHMHTTETDGRATLEEMAEAAARWVTNTSPSRTIPRRWPWPTGWMRSAWSSSPNGFENSTEMDWASESFQGSSATYFGRVHGSGGRCAG